MGYYTPIEKTTMTPTLTIDGRPEGSSRSFPVINPADDTVVCQCPDRTPEQLDRAVAAAALAFESWRRSDRASLRGTLDALAEKLSDGREEFARSLTTEQGKPLTAAFGEVDRAARILRTTEAFTGPVEIIEDSDRR